MNFIQKYQRIIAYLKIAITVTEQSTMISVGNKAWLSAPQCTINRDVVTSISNEVRVFYSEFLPIVLFYNTEVINLLKFSATVMLVTL